MIRKIVFVLLAFINGTAWALPAFPGAEGMGAAAVGGRGGTVYIVSNLNDSGSGSFREAAEATGARYVVFAVSGIINLSSEITIDDDNITILGQTSPGGIAIVGRMTYIYAKEVIIRHMRFRLSQMNITSGNAEQVGDAIQIGQYDTNITDPVTYNVVLDHCSLSWGVDETIRTECNTSDVTLSWCYITNSINVSVHPESPHGTGFIAWGRYSSYNNVSIHHTYFGEHRYRIPENNYTSFIDSVNNVKYYSYGGYTHFVQDATGTATANAIHNYHKGGYGPDNIDVRSVGIVDYLDTPAERVYMYGCLDDYRTTQGGSQWSVQEDWHGDQLASTGWQRSTPYPTTGFTGNGIAVTATTMSSSYASYVVANAGANKCQSGTCRDGVDTAAAAHYEAGTGSLLAGTDMDSLAEVQAAIGTLSGSPLTDSDSDGMADAWETATFGDLTQTAIGDYDSDGYDNLEEYSFYLAGDSQEQSVYPTASGITISNGSIH